eukprot:scaffold8237_cov157-Skeletonema_dohrnii-CCMP3373.AAC.2
MSSEQSTDPTAVGIPAAESEEALDIRSSMIMTQDWNLDVDSDELDDSPATVTDARQTFQNLVRSAIKYDTFKKGEADTVRRIIEHIELVSLKKSAEEWNQRGDIQSCAGGVLRCACVCKLSFASLFHDVNTMTGLFIHLMPPVVMYTFVWYNDRIVEAWPNLFNLSYLEDGLTYYGGTDSIASCSTAFYFTWWVIYVCFMLGGGGIDLPKKFKPDGSPANPRYDTVFHSTMRDGVCILIGKFFRGRSRAESLTLMETNIIIFFRLMLGASIVIAVVRGANRYTYYTTKMYSRVLRKEFAEQLAQSGGGEAKEGYTRLT